MAPTQTSPPFHYFLLLQQPPLYGPFPYLSSLHLSLYIYHGPVLTRLPIVPPQLVSTYSSLLRPSLFYLFSGSAVSVIMPFLFNLFQLSHCSFNYISRVGFHPSHISVAPFFVRLVALKFSSPV